MQFKVQTTTVLIQLKRTGYLHRLPHLLGNADGANKCLNIISSKVFLISSK
jgi:hypothetical protein